MAGDGTSQPGDAPDGTAARVGPFDDPDRYELLELRSSGGEGALWRACVRVGGVPLQVAVKVVHQQHLGELAQWRQRWQQQAELLRSLDHPALVKVREVFEGPLPHPPGRADTSGRTLYLVMNWVPGATLAEWVASHPGRTVRDVVGILAPVADAVDHLHSGTVTGYPILHRDIKPANVIVNGPLATLVDFGFVRLVQGDPVSIAGTPSYFAPELLQGGPSSEAADRYSLGATMYFALTGESPTGDQGRARAALTSAPPLAGRADLADHVLAMMNADPAHRPTSAVAWARSLAARAQSDTAPVLDPVPPMPAPLTGPPLTGPPLTGPPLVAGPASVAPPPAPAPRRRRWLLAVAAVLALLLGAAGAFAVTRMGDDDGDTVAVGDTPGTSTEVTERPPTTDTVPSSSSSTTETTVEALVMVEVVGLPREEAETALRAAGIGYEVAEQVGGGEIGTVIGQVPDPGAEVTGPAHITVAVPPDTMPDLVGFTLEDARAQLEEIGATATVVEVLDETNADGTVLAHTPAADEPFATEVRLDVARRPVSVLLADLDPVEGRFEEGQVSLNGTTYVHGLSVRSSSNPRLVGYNLGRHYRRFRTTIGQSDVSESGSTVRFEVLADGRPLLSRDLVLGEQVPVDLDVTNVLRLQLVVTRLGEASSSVDVYGAFADPHVIGLPSEVPATPGD